MTKREVIPRPGSLPQVPYSVRSFLRHLREDIQFKSPTIELPGFWTPKIDVYETDSAVVLEIEVPGMSPNDFSFTVDGDLIRIKGEKKHQLHEQSNRHHRTERRYGLFERILRLPAEVSPRNTNTIYQDGILVITLAKTPLNEQNQ